MNASWASLGSPIPAWDQASALHPPASSHTRSPERVVGVTEDVSSERAPGDVAAVLDLWIAQKDAQYLPRLGPVQGQGIEEPAWRLRDRRRQASHPASCPESQPSATTDENGRAPRMSQTPVSRVWPGPWTLLAKLNVYGKGAG